MKKIESDTSNTEWAGSGASGSESSSESSGGVYTTLAILPPNHPSYGYTLAGMSGQGQGHDLSSQQQAAPMLHNFLPPPPPQYPGGVSPGMRQAPQGEEGTGHSPSSNTGPGGQHMPGASAGGFPVKMDPRQVPMLSQLLQPGPMHGEKVVTPATTQVFLSESVPVARRQQASAGPGPTTSGSPATQQLPPKSPKVARASVATLGPQGSNRGIPVGQPSNALLGGPGLRPRAGSLGDWWQNQHLLQQQLRGIPQSVFLGNQPTMQRTPRVPHAYVNEDSQTAYSTELQDAGIGVPGGNGTNPGLKTRSQPNLVKDYVNLSPSQLAALCAGAQQDGYYTPTDTAGLLRENECLWIQVRLAQARMVQLEMMEQKVRQLETVYEQLMDSNERQRVLDLEMASHFEEEQHRLIQENERLRQVLSRALGAQVSQATPVPISSGPGLDTKPLGSGAGRMVSASASQLPLIGGQQMDGRQVYGHPPSATHALLNTSRSLRAKTGYEPPDYGVTSSTCWPFAPGFPQAMPTTSGGQAPHWNIDRLCDQLKQSMQSVVEAGQSNKNYPPPPAQQQSGYVLRNWQTANQESDQGSRERGTGATTTVNLANI